MNLTLMLSEQESAELERRAAALGLGTFIAC